MTIFDKLKNDSKYSLSKEKEDMIRRVVDNLLHPDKRKLFGEIKKDDPCDQECDSQQSKKTVNNTNNTLELNNTIDDNNASSGKSASTYHSNIDEPGLLLGKVQCGKTDTFVKIIGMCFDEGIDIAVVMTKGTNALATQTLTRLQKEFEAFQDPDDPNQLGIIVDDIRNRRIVGFRPAEIRDNKIILVVMKEDDNVNALINLFQNNVRLKEKNVLLVDDEADFVSRGYRPDPNNRQEQQLAVIAGLIDKFRRIPASCPYLLVTATPYSIILQPSGCILLNNGIALPFRPRFVELVPIHDKYIGGEQYFVESQNTNSLFSNLYVPVSDKCLDIMRNPHKTYIKSENKISTNLNGLLRALLGYLMATVIRSIQTNNRKYKSSAAFHVATENDLQDWEKQLIEHILKKIETEQRNNTVSYSSSVFASAFDSLYDNFKDSTEKANKLGKRNLDGSYTKTNLTLPTKKEIWDGLGEIFEDEDITVQLVNKTQVPTGQTFPPFLNPKTGQLRLTSKANIFIGGYMLDRGITIDNMLCFFYGRDPQTAQQDTVLQHARFYGARSIEDMTVTRLYTADRIYNNLVQIHDLDEFVRDWFKSGKYREGNAIPVATASGIRPSGSAKTLVSETYVLVYGKRFLPKGMIIYPGSFSNIDNLIRNAINNSLQTDGDFIKIPLDKAIEIMRSIQDSYVYKRNDNIERKRDMSDVISALEICGRHGNREVWLLLRKDREMSRVRGDGSGWSDAPDDGRSDTAPSKRQAVDCPVLMLLGQQGKKSQGWENGEPFYWPVVMVQKNMPRAVFPSALRN